MGTRLQLQTALEELLGSRNVYFQPPESTRMSYPAIVYNRDYQAVFFADNRPYTRRLRYQITVIDPDPDSLIPDRVAELPLTTLVRHFTLDNLNHDIYDVYFLGGVGMAVLVWDDTGKRRYETGVDQGILFPLNAATSLYDTGVAWNGLTTVTETPAGAEANPAYADNIKYLNLLSTETFGGTIEAFTYPDEFQACDGSYVPVPGLIVGQQSRPTFGLSYRSKIGNDVTQDLGFKYHLAYGLQAAPSEKAYSTINDSPEAIGFSWDVTSTPAPVTGKAPTSLIVVDSTKVNAAALSTLLDFLHGTAGTNPSLPPPDQVLALFTGTITMITLTAPTFDGAHTVTIPSQTGTTYYVDGVVRASGPLVLTTGQKKVVSASPNAGYAFNVPYVNSWLFSFVS